MSRFSGYLKALGPGLLWAATAIGVSHVVQATRAGATYGFSLVGIIVVALVLKYPLFEAGPRYAVATGESLLEGYVGLGRWAGVLYLVLTVGTMFTVLAAVTLVTAGLAQGLFGAFLSPVGWSVTLLAVSASILIVGRFPWLDGIIKAIILLLAVSTLAALVLAVARTGGGAGESSDGGLVWDASTVAFLVAILGWMPTGVDAAAWHSLWTLRRARQTGYRPSWPEARMDFNIGYIGTSLIALAFLALGALIMRPSGEAFAASAGGFAVQLVDLYSGSLGGWSRPIIQVAAFTTMFSTVLAVSDGFPRVLARMRGLLTSKTDGGDSGYWISLGALMLGALTLILYLRSRFTVLIDLATTLSFLTAPILGYLNYRVVTGPRVDAALAPPWWWRVLSWVALVFLSGLGLVYLSSL